MHRARAVVWLLALLAVIGCTPQSAVSPSLPQGPPPDFPAAYYRRAAAEGEAVYRVVPGLSRVVVRVHRAGPLSVFGHGHIVASRDLHGYVVLGTAPGQSRADLYLPLEGLEIDDPALRRAAGLGRPLSAEDVRATRGHMLHPVLEAEHYPFVLAHIEPLADEPGYYRIVLELHGHRQRYTIPLQIQHDARDFHASGQLRILQTRFGIRPYAVLGGALWVADGLDLTFEVTGVRLIGVR